MPVAEPDPPVVPGGVLVVDDDPGVRDLVAMTLELHGHRVVTAADGMEALHLLERHRPEAVVLDVMMPGVSGMEVLERIRTSSDVPVLLLTALTSGDNVVLGLRKGADDYVVKPFAGDELAARVDALLRRSRGTVVSPELVFDQLVVDVRGRRVTVDGAEVELTAKEFDLLAYLAASPGTVFTREELLRDVWNSSSEWQQAGTVTEHIRRLRLKIEPDPERPRWVQTVRGVGYRFERRARA